MSSSDQSAQCWTEQGETAFAGKKRPRRYPMTMPKEYQDYTTSSVAGLLTLFIILVGNVLVAGWFFYFY